jgi:hypothetical protein
MTVHNYCPEFGGEDRVFEDKSSLLESKGTDVARFTRRNSYFEGLDCDISHSTGTKEARAIFKD